MEDTDRTLSLVSKTGDKFEVSYTAGAFDRRKLIVDCWCLYSFPLNNACLYTAKLSQLVSDATEKFEDCDTTPPVEILKVESECLAKVIDFLMHYQQDPLEEIKTPLSDNTFNGVVKQPWYREFVAVDNPMLFDLVTAANFMAIRECDIYMHSCSS